MAQRPVFLNNGATGLKQVGEGPKFSRKEGPADPTIKLAFAKFQYNLPS